MRTGEYPDDWEERRQKVLDRDGYECQECGETDAEFHVHHIKPISQGGGHQIGNLETLCESCHAKEHPTIITLRSAISENKRLKMTYTSPSSGTHTREFDPYAIEMYNGMQFVLGHDSRHDEIRFFRPKRIQSLQETDATFECPSGFDAQEFLDENMDYGNSDCFIATAAYGTSHATDIDRLRAFRDKVLLESAIGRRLVRWYHALSPPVADLISRSVWRQTLIRWLVIAPVLKITELFGIKKRNTPD